MVAVEWAELPPDGRLSPTRDSVYDEFRDALRANPGRWAILKANASQGYSGNLRKMTVWQGFEITTRRLPNDAANRRTVFARFIGDPDGTT
jgi:hypothetical protein